MRLSLAALRPLSWRVEPSALAGCALLLSLLAMATQTRAQLPYVGSLALRPPLPVQVEAIDGATRVRIGRRGALELTLPGMVEAVETRVIALARGRRVGIVETRGPVRHVLVVEAVRGRPHLHWSGRLDWRGDPGERRRDVLRIEDRTGDGFPDLIVGFEEEGRRVCGQQSTLLSPRALDPRSGELRPVTLRRLPELEGESVITATREAHPPPLLHALVPASASSQAGSEVTGPPVGLTDGDAATGWIEGRPGAGRWEFATLHWQAPSPIRAVALTVGLPGATAPRTLWLVHESGRVRVAIPDSAPGTWWIPMPAPVRSRCLSIVLDEAQGDVGHVGLAEIRVYTELDGDRGLDALVDRLADSASASDAVRLLIAVGAPALRALAARWEDMPSAERRRALRVFAAHPDDEVAREGLLQAAQDPGLRAVVLEAALQAGTVAVLEPLVELGGEAGDTAALALSRRHPEAAVRPLLAALGRDGGADRPGLREALRTAFQRGAGEEETFRRWLDSAPTSARAAVALALARGGESLGPLAREAFLAARSDEGLFVDRWRLLEAAARLGPDEVVDTWVANMASAPEWMIRAAALETLTARRSSHRRALARQALTDDYPRVRIAAVRSLANLGLRGRDVERVAFRARRDPWPMVRAAAVEALVPSVRARRILVAALEDPSPLVRAAAVDGLNAAGDGTAWPQVRARLEDDREWPVVLRAALRFARRRCLPDAIAPLGAVVERALRPNPWAPDLAVAAEALAVAASIGGDESTTLIRRAARVTAPAPLRDAAAAASRAEACRPPASQSSDP